MNARSWLPASVAALIFVAACAVEDLNADVLSGPPSAATPAGAGVEAKGSTGLPCDVSALLERRCQTCHAAEPRYGASSPLVTWDDLQRSGPGAYAGRKVLDVLRERIGDDARPMPPSPRPRLEDDERATLEGWIAAGAPRSDARCEAAPRPTGVAPLSCKPDTVLQARSAFTMRPGTPTDSYVCFGVDVTLAKKRHVVGLAPKVDNPAIVHHILLFQTDRAESPEPFPCQAFGSAAWKLVAGWAPGGSNLELPKEAGFPAEAGTTHWVLQIHYNNATAKTGTDRSGYELCTTEELREHDAGVLAFGSINFAIPPRATHTIACDYALGRDFEGVRLFNASPHMHQLGAAMSTERLPGGSGPPQKIFDQPSFSFEAQANHPIASALAPGDVVRTRCTWKNPTGAIVGFGEGTGDEMCFNFVGYYPKIPDRTILGVPLFTWVTPSASAACAVEQR